MFDRGTTGSPRRMPTLTMAAYSGAVGEAEGFFEFYATQVLPRLRES